MDGRKRRRMVRRSRKARKNFLILLTVVLITGIGTIAMGAQTQKTEEVYYESVLIHSGDTLWDIAKKFYTTIENIMELNGLESEEVKPGDGLLLMKKVER